MFCPKCGNETQPGQQFCPTCGMQLPNLDQPQAPVQPQTPVQPQAPQQTQAPVRKQAPKQKKSPVVPIMCGVIAVLLIAVVIVLVMVLTKKDDAAQAPQQNQTENAAKDQKKSDDAEAEWTMPPGGGNSEGEFVDDENIDEMPNDHDNLTYVTVATQKMDDATVEVLTKEDRRYYVNTLYAYYGYRFKNKEMQTFFESQEWYEPDMSVEPGDQDSISKKFDSIAKYNLKKLS